MNNMFEHMYWEEAKVRRSLENKIMEFRDKLPEDLRKEYDTLFNIATPTEKLNKLVGEVKKYYLINEESKTLEEAKEGDTIYFEMPPFCSGEYEAKVYKDEKGLYINKEDNFFEGCRDYRVNKQYWKDIK